jgi:hypothetical protein
MRRFHRSLLAVSCVCAALALPPARSAAQVPQELPDRILNPQPDFDPFEKPPSTPLYFPDDVDKRARSAMIAALTGDSQTLADDLKFFTERDAQLKKERGTTTGLSDAARDLYNNTIEDRARYLAAQRQALSFTAMPQQKQLIESRLKNDDLNQADEQLKKAAQNKWGGILNRMLGSVNIANVMTGNYTSAAIDSAVQQLMAFTTNDMPIEERRALALLNEHLRRYPDDPRNPEVRQRIEDLEKKKRRVLAQKQLDRAEEAIGKKDFDKAEFYYQVAAVLDPLSKDAEAGVDRMKRRAQAEDQETKKALQIVRPPVRAPMPENRDISGLLYALTLRDDEQIRAQADQLEKKYRGMSQAEIARDARSVALEIKGSHEEAKKILQQVARSSNSHERDRARVLVENPEYNLLASFQGARTKYQLDTVKYVLLGDDFLKKNLMLAAPLLISGPSGLPTVAAANGIMMATNLIQVLTANPISNQDVIDKGVQYVRAHPESKDTSDVYTVLADAYEHNGMYEKALAYNEMSGRASDKKLADLKDKAAKNLLQAAARTQDRGAQEYFLKEILDNYAESEAAKDATQRLSRMTRAENQGLRMTKKFLMENPELYGPQGLGLKASLFDGNLNNMELADKGVSVLGDNEILLNLQTPWGVRTQTYRLDEAANSRFQMAVRQRNFDVAMADVDTRPKNSEGGLKNVPTTVLAGNLAKKPAEDPYPETTFTFVREAGAPTTARGKGPDVQLQTEVERDPTKRYSLPPLQGSISASHFDISGNLPAGLLGERLMIGHDSGSPFAGVQMPIPLLKGFIPVDFMVQNRGGRLGIFPKIRLSQDKGEDQQLYR